jgi:hypothetical protein
MSLQSEVIRLESLFQKQDYEHVFVQGILADYVFGNVFVNQFLTHQGFQTVKINCAVLEFIRYQEDDDFLREAFSQAKEQARLLEKPIILLENSEILNDSTRSGKGQDFLIELFSNSEQMLLENKCYVPVVLSSQGYKGYFPQKIMDNFALYDYPYIDDEDLRYSSVLRDLYSQDKLEKHEQYHKIMQEQDELQLQKLKAEKSMMKKAISKEKNKIKNQNKIS